jgi:hypothetical protein
MIDFIYSFYENTFGATDFYAYLKQKREINSLEYNPHILLSEKSIAKQKINGACMVEAGDLRIDMPMLIGNVEAKKRILVLGLEPRHTDDFYNILKKGKMVFGTPFGIDRWYSEAKQNIYASAFQKYLSPERLFLFSDFVKEYEVIDPSNKIDNNTRARIRFEELFRTKYQNILEEEIALFKPDIIIGMGKTDIYGKVPTGILREHNIKVICHPINGNYQRMIKGMDEIFY